ncbi:MAG: hypothetical protein OXP73_08405 [Chloroflexota bacterium]|nr:hypothetical protein [Chloroflexota bacterium]
MSRNATDGFTKARPWSVTLHDAMVTVLRNSRRECTPSEIAAGITDGDLYRKGDGSHPSSSQISARANNYPRLFYKNHTTGAWGLNDKGWKASMTDAEHDHGDGAEADEPTTAAASWRETNGIRGLRRRARIRVVALVAFARTKRRAVRADTWVTVGVGLALAGLILAVWRALADEIRRGPEGWA